MKIVIVIKTEDQVLFNWVYEKIYKSVATIMRTHQASEGWIADWYMNVEGR